MYRYILLMLACVVLSCEPVHAQVINNPVIAFDQAQQTGKKILLIFSGSDWCIPCIRFHKKILSDSTFQHFASEYLVLLEADFPQHKKIPEPLRSQYDVLAEQFNPDGEFPQVVLLSPEKKLIAKVPFDQQTPAAFITAVSALLK
ncbi:thioredoxin-related protein [Chitinophaga niastensis]|uniref:Thioredoxin-related protein n=1 Tax=Chitinophaga niastensis TaxID=536980 RepID=A0A2P8HDH6_CHINA|nr:thioredoxin family protein [Chitinophaga niastensis]PSL44284.1 thioredoxin-related protein [Chitinophaga niastensis]